jgi:hypothetical protein
MILAMDRDHTVDTAGGPVPSVLLRQAAQHGHEVWAIGNQALKDEAGIPGTDELWARLNEVPALPPTGESAAEILADPAKIARNVAAKRERLEALARLLPHETTRVVVDDLDVSLPGWIYLTPEQFCELHHALCTP